MLAPRRSSLLNDPLDVLCFVILSAMCTFVGYSQVPMLTTVNLEHQGEPFILCLGSLHNDLGGVGV